MVLFFLVVGINEHLMQCLFLSLYFVLLGAIKRERSHFLLVFQTPFLNLSPQPSPHSSLNVYYHGPKVVQLRWVFHFHYLRVYVTQGGILFNKKKKAPVVTFSICYPGQHSHVNFNWNKRQKNNYRTYLNLNKCIVTWCLACDLFETSGHMNGLTSCASMEISFSEVIKMLCQQCALLTIHTHNVIAFEITGLYLHTVATKQHKNWIHVMTDTCVDCVHV